MTPRVKASWQLVIFTLDCRGQQRLMDVDVLYDPLDDDRSIVGTLDYSQNGLGELIYKSLDRIVSRTDWGRA